MKFPNPSNMPPIISPRIRKLEEEAQKATREAQEIFRLAQEAGDKLDQLHLQLEELQRRLRGKYPNFSDFLRNGPTTDIQELQKESQELGHDLVVVSNQITDLLDLHSAILYNKKPMGRA